MTQADQALNRAGGAPLRDFTRRYLGLAQRLLGPLAGGYLLGSVAAGEADPRVSDLDLLLVATSPSAAQVRLAAGEQLADAALQCPLRGVELVVYLDDVVRNPGAGVTYDLNINGGRDLARSVSTEGEPGFWFVLDIAAARDCALALFGPEPTEAFAPVPSEQVRDALAAALRWHLENAPATADAVLNAARGWYWLEHGRWVSKVAAGRWASAGRDLPVVAAALDARAGGDDGAVLPAADVAHFQQSVLRRVLSQA